jgi:hypothetical protein
VRNAAGTIQSVHYETLNVLLLNELQRQQRQLQDLDALKQRVSELEQLVNTLLAANTSPMTRR